MRLHDVIAPLTEHVFDVDHRGTKCRPLILRLTDDNTIDVMLSGIRQGHYVSVNDAIIDQSARLRAAVRPPGWKGPDKDTHELFESPEMQLGIELLARLLTDDWVRRIAEFARDRDSPISNPYDLAAGTFNETFKHGKHLKKLPDKLRNFIKQAAKHHLRLVASLQTEGNTINGEYISHAVWEGNTQQPEIYLYFPMATFERYRDDIRAGNTTAIRALLATRQTTLDHELRHAYDDFASGGKFRKTAQARTARLDKAFAEVNPSDENQQLAHQSYLAQPHEISARYHQTIALARSYLRGPWQDYMLFIKFHFGGWQKLPPETKLRLLKRMAGEWTAVHGRAAIDIAPFITKLNAKVRANAKDVWIQPSHGNIEVSGLDHVSPQAQASILHQVTYLGDIFRRQVVTYDDVPMLKGFDFVRNTGRNIDYRISARFRRSPRARDVTRVA